MTPDLLRQVGEALYGPRWQSDLARELSVDGSLMRRWISGDRPIPSWVRSSLVEAIGRHQRALGDALGLLDVEPVD